MRTGRLRGDDGSSNENIGPEDRETAGEESGLGIKFTPDKTPLLRDKGMAVGQGSSHGRADGPASLLHAKKYSVREAAKKLGIGETKMREIIKKGEIPVVMIDGKHLLVEADLETFLQRHYGPVRETEVRRSGMQPLPKHIMESDLLNEAG